MRSNPYNFVNFGRPVIFSAFQEKQEKKRNRVLSGTKMSLKTSFCKYFGNV
jgi:hypothetical protein